MKDKGYNPIMEKGGKRAGAGRPKKHIFLFETLESLLKTHPNSIITLSHEVKSGGLMAFKGTASQLLGMLSGQKLDSKKDLPILKAGIRKPSSRKGSWIRF